MMKKQLSVLLLSALLLSSCASGRMGSAGAIMAGASIGGSLGGSIGGVIGDNNHGWRGGYRGSAIGNIVGTLAGAAIGGAISQSRRDQQIEDDAYIPEVREVREVREDRGDWEDHRDWEDRGNREARGSREDRGNRDKREVRGKKQKKAVQARPLTPLVLRNIRFMDDNRSHEIDAGENCKIIFEIMNEGKESAFNVVPLVQTVGKVKHLGISPSVMVEEILPGEGIRYTASVHAGERLKDGEIMFCVAVADENGVVCDSQEFTLPARRRE